MLTMFLAEELSFFERNVYLALGKRGTRTKAKKVLSPSVDALIVLCHLKIQMACYLVVPQSRLGKYCTTELHHYPRNTVLVCFLVSVFVSLNFHQNKMGKDNSSQLQRAHITGGR